MALKDITLGQFFPGNSFLHRLDPRCKIIMVFCYIVCLFLASSALGYCLIFLLLSLGIALSKVPLSAILKGMKPLAFIAVFTALLNVFYTPGEIILWEFYFLTITAEGIVHAIFMVSRILMLVTGTFLLTYTTSPMVLTDGLENLMAGWSKLGVPVQDLAMMMSIALRFIPNLMEETDKIMSAQRARGADFESGNLPQRAKALLPILVPLFISALRRAEELADAMDCRCYHTGPGRSKMNQLQFSLRDFLMMFWMGSVTLVFILVPSL